ncbi:hypothetical protein [Heliothis virescens ascovirus 3g]|uniref:Uncharacterized protein n=1 Tax=Heliothis virescens ascovirus 3g TaxID=1246651 RepID=K4NYH3_9VIRU|nr:hypothetical protein F8204_gp155 [Heliothis virescens ascovirus 3g]AFV50407.1 hypothetical protein [Heliothis virescens ascovirus 3g]
MTLGLLLRNKINSLNSKSYMARMLRSRTDDRKNEVRRADCDSGYMVPRRIPVPCVTPMSSTCESNLSTSSSCTMTDADRLPPPPHAGSSFNEYDEILPSPSHRWERPMRDHYTAGSSNVATTGGVEAFVMVVKCWDINGPYLSFVTGGVFETYYKITSLETTTKQASTRILLEPRRLIIPWNTVMSCIKHKLGSESAVITTDYVYSLTRSGTAQVEETIIKLICQYTKKYD